MNLSNAITAKMSRYACRDAYSDLIWVLKVTSTMPYKNTNLQQKIRATILWGWFLAFFVTLTMEFFISYDNVEIMCELLYFFIGYISIIFKKYTYMKSDQLIRIFEKLDSAEFNNEKGNVRKPLSVCVIKAKKLIKVFTYLVLSVLILYVFMPILDHKRLAVPFSYNLGIYTTYFRWFQQGAMIIAASAEVVTDCLCAVFLIIAAAQVDILRLKLIDITSHNLVGTTLVGNQIDRDRKIQENLKECVRLHLCIIDFVDDLEKLYSPLIFTQYTTNMAVQCLLMYHIVFLVKFQSLRFVLLVLTITFIFGELFLYHYLGNELMTKSLKIVDACYFSQWYYCDQKVRKMLLIMMERAKIPLYLSIYGFDMVTLSSFGKVLKWSYSLFALLRGRYKN